MTSKRSMAVAWLAAALAACSGSSGNLAVSAKSAADAPATGVGASSLDAGNGISIDEIRLVVRKIEVEGPTAGCTSSAASPVTAGAAKNGADDPGGSGSGSGSGGSGRGGADDGPDHDAGEESCEIEAGPFLVVLSGADLVSGTHPAFETSVPAGTYHEISVRIDPISAEKAARAPVESQRDALADLAARGVSLEVTGTDGGAPFTFSAAIDARLKREGSITIDADSTASLTFTLGASGWFAAADGTRLDPSDPAARGAILANVAASFRLVHDEDHDGADDQDDDRGDHGPGHP